MITLRLFCCSTMLVAQIITLCISWRWQIAGQVVGHDFDHCVSKVSLLRGRLNLIKLLARCNVSKNKMLVTVASNVIGIATHG